MNGNCDIYAAPFAVFLNKDRTAGVQEYWIVNPMLHTVTIYDFKYGKNLPIQLRE